MSNPISQRACPLCSKPATANFRPFCSRGCRDRDLNAWFGERYRVPAPPVADEDETLEPDAP